MGKVRGKRFLHHVGNFQKCFSTGRPGEPVYTGNYRLKYKNGGPQMGSYYNFLKLRKHFNF